MDPNIKVASGFTAYLTRSHFIYIKYRKTKVETQFIIECVNGTIETLRNAFMSFELNRAELLLNRNGDTSRLLTVINFRVRCLMQYTKWGWLCIKNRI